MTPLVQGWSMVFPQNVARTHPGVLKEAPGGPNVVKGELFIIFSLCNTTKKCVTVAQLWVAYTFLSETFKCKVLIRCQFLGSCIILQNLAVCKNDEEKQAETVRHITWAPGWARIHVICPKWRCELWLALISTLCFSLWQMCCILNKTPTEMHTCPCRSICIFSLFRNDWLDSLQWKCN